MFEVISVDHRDIPIPARLLKRPRNSQGYVITYVTFLDSVTREPNFRVVDHARVERCAKYKLCGLCGEELETIRCFIGGPESVDNRMFSDPPMHLECGRYAMRVCPYLRSPKGKHNLTPTDGITVVSNPLAGTVRPDKLAIYSTKKFRAGLVAAAPGDEPVLCFHVGKPIRIEWFD